MPPDKEILFPGFFFFLVVIVSEISGQNEELD